jgi:hypothetical protein
MEADELAVRAYDLFQERHTKWASEFRDYVLARDLPEEKFDTFVRSVARSWVDGRKRHARNQGIDPRL